MMSSLPSPSCGGGRLALAVAVCFLLPCCFGSKAATEIFEKACHCFDDHNVYSECREELRLGVEGAFHVGKGSVDEYCEGPCLAETKMALRCVEEVAADEGFRFYSGASVPAVRAALSTGCGDTPDRGTFEIRERRECGDEYYSYHNRHEQEQPAAAGYGEEGGQEYPGGGAAAWGDYCYGAGGPSRAALCFSMLQQVLLLVFVSAALLPLVV
ncbi:hypothetical protein GUJ93_ZPchr0005g14365 [Zizania palustris]|uniref:DUF7731 domain-containing protein n=1 Tax=Zizania palustris TaxID=103762 RepID=A0A8J5VHG1_ZIZPA|nr:hypothetical protein GUJ93_ZPchr0005g14365 [Zizania palustris]